MRKRIASRLTSEYVDVFSEELYQALLRYSRESRELKKQIRKIEKELALLGYTETELSERVILNIDFQILPTLLLPNVPCKIPLILSQWADDAPRLWFRHFGFL